MSPGNDSAGPNKRIQSLVQLCQRVAGNYIESISSLGELPFTLVRPILDRCSAEQLLRVEDASPHLKRDSEELWRALCRRTYPAMVERYGDGTDTSPDSWRSRFFVLREAEATRLEEVGSRLRLQRLEADERKKEREIKLTDRLPPPKRQRTGWNMSAPSKTLFQKTRSEASKLQKNMYHTRMIPPMLKGKDYSPTGSISNRSPLPAQSKYSTRVVVNTVIRRPSSSSASSSEPAALPSKTLNASPSKPVALPSTWRAENRSLSSSRNDAITRKHTPQNSPISTPEIVPPLPKSFSLAKKDPMASLFVPKHRAYSQRAR
ncbi:RNA polymerase II transcription factor SIII subunit A-domain-containing protein [Lentinula edodes]|uniref:RNA polymerase II transcription factor SIII subunit A-domain-containing protein n=1 Tax=Lentinula edodes TaxID=5353 RepID=UPI001E8CC0E6|nr:RNA polymerase II transcription factor SIII subunit A-domain-containing protein [Lentinula edodes]KAH7873595.1 RNA polymerase II transcription factor SIII subunit A-domain-containing protein [Lentinula edodes]